MKNFVKTLKNYGIEGSILLGLLGAVAVVLAISWGAAMKLRQTVAANAQIMHVDTSPMTDVEHMRALADSQIQDSRAFFLMGSKSIFDKQKSEKEDLAKALDQYASKNSDSRVREIVEHIKATNTQEAELFAQAEDFRSKQTESKIVGQFYQSKTAYLLNQVNADLDKLRKMHETALVEARTTASKAGIDAQNQIPMGMTWLSGAVAILSGLFALLTLQVLWSRAKVLRQRERLVDEAKSAVLARDEVISAYTQDFKEPLSALSEIADHLRAHPQNAAENAELVKSTVAEMQSLIADIADQTKATTGGLYLRLEQLAIADVLDEAQTFLQPIAKQRDITLQFDAVNQSVLAYIDRERLMRVLSNLVGNALKFSPKHSRVHVKVKSDAQFVNISVIDSGPQIPDARLAKIFDNFWQARKTSEQGAGVGLSVVKSIIEAHGGVVKAEHNLQNGNTFTFSLSRRRPLNAQLKKPQSSGVRKIARAAATPGFESMPENPAH